MDPDDHAVLNLLAKSEAPTAQNSGSATTDAYAEDYLLHGMWGMSVY